MNKREITIMLLALCALFLLHINAMANHWYLHYRGFDMPMHFLGGICVALSIQCLGRIFWKRLFSISAVVWLTFIATICWEIFEAYYGIAGHRVGTGWYWFDSIKDIIVGTIGGWLVISNRYKLFGIGQKPKAR